MNLLKVCPRGAHRKMLLESSPLLQCPAVLTSFPPWYSKSRQHLTSPVEESSFGSHIIVSNLCVIGVKSCGRIGRPTESHALNHLSREMSWWSSNTMLHISTGSWHFELQLQLLMLNIFHRWWYAEEMSSNLHSKKYPLYYIRPSL